MKLSVRGLGIPALLLGVFLLHREFPAVQSIGWDDVRAFRFDGELCSERLRSRETVTYTHPEGREVTTWGELARDFNLEISRVCLHNGEGRGCERRPLKPGDTVELPLALDAPEGRP